MRRTRQHGAALPGDLSQGRDPSGYTMDHTASIYLMDAKGEFFGTLDSKETPAVRQAKLKRLLIAA